MIKIAFIIDTIESPTAGTEKQLVMLLKHLDRKRFAPTLFVLRSSSWLEKEFSICPLEVINFRSFLSPVSYFNFLRFVKKLRNGRFNCLQTHFVESNIVGIAAAKLGSVQYILSSRRDQGYWHSAGKLMLLRMLNQWVNVFVANCHATAKWASKTEGISPSQIKVVHNGVELEHFSIGTICEKLSMRTKLGIQGDAVVIGIVANLRPVKRIDNFLQAAAIVRAEIPKAQFIIAGEGELRTQLELQAFQLGISDCTHFLGKRTDIPKILKALDIAVLSSDSESFSNSIVEYLATGLPMVVTDVGGCREMIENGINGYVVAASDAEAMAGRIVDLIKLADLNLMGRCNSEKARKMFSYEKMIDSFVQIYTYQNNHD